MPITFNCTCGEPLQVSDAFAGLTIHCKHCGQSVNVPLLDGQAAAPAPAPAAAPRPFATSPPPAPPPPPPAPKVPTDLKKGSGVGEPPPHGEEGQHEGTFSGGAMYGALLMAGAVVWFVVGYAAGRIFFYPPILFIIGLVTFVKGLQENK